MGQGMYAVTAGLTTSFVIGTVASAASFHLSSPAFEDNSAIPKVYTCDGQNLSPPLQWSAPPAKTKTQALLVYDPDTAQGVFNHWVLYNIPAQVTRLPAGVSGVGTAGTNSYNQTQYNGPCPPLHRIHRYIFSLIAIDQVLALPAGAKADEVAAAIAGHIVSKTRLVGVFGRE